MYSVDQEAVISAHVDMFMVTEGEQRANHLHLIDKMSKSEWGSIGNTLYEGMMLRFLEWLKKHPMPAFTKFVK